MVIRMAAALALVAFAMCLVIGALEAGNPFGTTVKRALIAMAGTLVIGLLVGAAFHAMLRENLRTEEQRLRTPPATAANSEGLGNEGKPTT